MTVDPISPALATLHRESAIDGGTLADYIPSLALADPEWFGDRARQPRRRRLLRRRLDDRVHDPVGLQAVRLCAGAGGAGRRGGGGARGLEPSGEPFNSITLEPGTGRPANPLVNAGAILTTSLVGAFERIAACLSAFAGRELAIDEAVYASEHETGDRNRAIAYLMRSAGSLRADAIETVDTYFRQCSVLVTAHDLAVMAATLANAGRNPLTGRRVVAEATAQRVLSVMCMCGMYDGAGAWMVRVGLPAKSGVSGGLLAVSPGQFGIGLFSPRLDARGNTVRGVAACELLSDRFGLHLLHDPQGQARSAKVVGPRRPPRSTRRRARDERAELERRGDELALLTLRGDLDFAAAELALVKSPRREPAG